MRVKIYQIDHKRDTERIRFCGLDELKQWQENYDGVNASIYDKVFDAEVCADGLETVFTRFNRDDRPGGRIFCSMSVSDVVGVLQEDGSWKYFFCDMVGFKEIDFDADKAGVIPNIGKTIKVVYVEPGKPARVTQIDNTAEGFRAALGCTSYEAACKYWDETTIYCDSNGKFNETTPNRPRYDKDGVAFDIIFGTFIIAAAADDEDLSDDLCEKYLALYA